MIDNYGAHINSTCCSTKYFAKLQSKGQFTDFTLIANDKDGNEKQIKVHKIILAMVSEYFCDYFQKNNTSSANLSDITTYENMSLLIDAAYGRSFHVSYDDVMQYCEIQRMFKVKQFDDGINLFLDRELRSSDDIINEKHLSVMRTIAKYGKTAQIFTSVLTLPHIMELCDYYDDVLIKPLLLKLTYEELNDVLSSDRLQCSELQLCLYIQAWVGQRQSQRCKHAHKLLKHINFQFINIDELSNLKSRLFSKKDKFSEILHRIIETYYSECKSKLISFNFQQTIKRRLKLDFLLILNNKVYEFYAETNGNNCSIHKLREDISFDYFNFISKPYLKILTCQNKIFLIDDNHEMYIKKMEDKFPYYKKYITFNVGSSRAMSDNGNVYEMATDYFNMYNSVTRKWKDIKVPFKLAYSAMLIHSKTIYIIGGLKEQDDGKYIACKECWKCEGGIKWLKLPDMKYVRKQHLVCHSPNKLYVFGGLVRYGDSFKAIDDQECYNFTSKSWSVIKFTGYKLPTDPNQYFLDRKNFLVYFLNSNDDCNIYRIDLNSLSVTLYMEIDDTGVKKLRNASLSGILR